MQFLKTSSVLFLLLATTGTAAEKFKLKGSVATGFGVKRFKTGESGYEARLKLRTKRKKGFKGTIGVKGLSDEPFLVMQDAFIEKSVSESALLKFGFTKKIIGLNIKRSVS